MRSFFRICSRSKRIRILRFETASTGGHRDASLQHVLNAGQRGRRVRRQAFQRVADPSKAASKQVRNIIRN